MLESLKSVPKDGKVEKVMDGGSSSYSQKNNDEFNVDQKSEVKQEAEAPKKLAQAEEAKKEEIKEPEAPKK